MIVKFRVNITESETFSVEVEAEGTAQAEELAFKMLEDSDDKHDEFYAYDATSVDFERRH